MIFFLEEEGTPGTARGGGIHDDLAELKAVVGLPRHAQKGGPSRGAWMKINVRGIASNGNKVLATKSS